MDRKQGNDPVEDAFLKRFCSEERFRLLDMGVYIHFVSAIAYSKQFRKIFVKNTGFTPI